MRRAAAWLGWWVALTGLWLLLVGAVTWVDLAAGGAAGVLGASGADYLRSRGLLTFAPEPRLLARAWHVPWRVVADFGLVTLALATSLCGGSRLPGASRR